MNAISSFLRRRALAAGFLLLAAVPAMAQDLSQQWADRVTRELSAEKAAPQAPQLTYSAVGGLLFVYDSNIFLSENNKIGDQVWIPFLRAGIDYAEPNWTVGAELEADYKYYVETEDARADDERFLARFGYAGSSFGASLIQMIRNESDPVDAVFASRTERLVSDTIPRFYVDITPIITVEFDAQVEIVRFAEDVFSDAQDNENYRMGLNLVYKSDLNIDFVIRGGMFFIHYNDKRDTFGDPTAPPDATGWFAMGGIRGDIRPDLYIEALLGIESVASDDFDFMSQPPHDGRSLNTMNAQLVARYKAVERLSASASYTRNIGFAGGQDPYQVVDQFLALMEYQAMEHVTVNARAQASFIRTALGVERSYYSIAAFANWKVVEHVIVDGGVTFRFGHVAGDVSTTVDYNDVVLQVGVGLAW